jgi:ABC-type molybdate transport system substrate-binding protein
MEKALAKEFSDFLQSVEGHEIFAKWGWVAP